MSKKKKNSNAPETNDEQFKIDPRVEDAIFSKKDSLITITTNSIDGKLTASNFHLVYDAIEDRYNFYSDGLDKDQFFALMHKFFHYCGIITIRTFLDEISHQHYTPEGRGSRQMCRVDRYGFPRTSPKGSKSVEGFQTGDMVKVIILKGSKKGEYLGKVAVRSSKKFDIQTKTKTIKSIWYKHFHIVQRSDGYLYSYKERI